MKFELKVLAKLTANKKKKTQVRQVCKFFSPLNKNARQKIKNL